MFTVIMVKFIKGVRCLFPSGIVPEVNHFFFVISACTRTLSARFSRNKDGRNEECDNDAEEKESFVRHFGFGVLSCVIALVWDGINNLFMTCSSQFRQNYNTRGGSSGMLIVLDETGKNNDIFFTRYHNLMRYYHAKA